MAVLNTMDFTKGRTGLEHTYRYLDGTPVHPQWARMGFTPDRPAKRPAPAQAKPPPRPRAESESDSDSSDSDEEEDVLDRLPDGKVVSSIITTDFRPDAKPYGAAGLGMLLGQETASPIVLADKVIMTAEELWLKNRKSRFVVIQYYPSREFSLRTNSLTVSCYGPRSMFEAVKERAKQLGYRVRVSSEDRIVLRM